MEIKGKSVLILGFGKEGKSVFNFLQKNYPKIKIGIADKKKIKNPKASEIFYGENYLASINSGKYEIIIRSPGIKYGKELLEFKKNGGNITTLINIFFSLAKGKIVGITGTKGKSTTTSLIYKILGTKYKDVRLVGNIGRPALDYLGNQTKDTIFVCELSSQQLEDSKYSPYTSIFLNVVPDHLNHHESFAAYIDSKKKIFKFQKPGDFLIFNNDYNLVSEKEIVKGVNVINFGFKNDRKVFFENNSIFIRDEKEQALKILDIKDINLIGKGNIENIMAAISAGVALGCEIKAIAKTIKKFKNLPHRIEFVGEFNGIKFYNDSISTVPDAIPHALDGLKTKGQKVEVLIAGGSSKNVGFDELGKSLNDFSDLKHIAIFPVTGEEIKKAYFKNNPKGKIIFHEVLSMESAVGICKKYCSKGSTCLLSPGSASFGIFKDYKDRGNQFKKLVKTT
ncbi:MAG: UDP-N-acetylmuramoyl-L-alanine--D-glutamate ligase [Candidatus Pacebacteria bacterium]|nr:UDP-N-acetylmuramoyl-L-alanine--D-glutamate ligase [Candidatus Paceibacterota bacterium]